MDETWEQDAKWNKPVTKAQTLYNSTYEISRVVKFIETGNRVVIAIWYWETLNFLLHLVAPHSLCVPDSFPFTSKAVHVSENH